MAEIHGYPILRHLRGDPSFHILRFKRGKPVMSGRGLTFWFHALNSSIAEVPMDDRELPFLYRARSGDFQDVTVQGVITYRVVDPERVAERVDFSIDLKTGQLLKKPLDVIAGMLTELAQQFTWNYLANTVLTDILEHGFEVIRGRILEGLADDAGIEAMGLEVVSVRINGLRAESSVEKALQTPMREKIQQQADEATFERRALAVEKERAISENELQTQIELAKREEVLVAQEGANERKRATELAAANRIAVEAKAQNTGIEAHAEAERIECVEEARVQSEQARMDIYRDMPSEVMMGLAMQKLAGKLQRIEHLNLTPDLLGSLLTNLAKAGTARLEAGQGQS